MPPWSQFHHQITPAVGSKPAGFRSVMRGELGRRATLYWWADRSRWQLERPSGTPDHVQEVALTTGGMAASRVAWQWVDLDGDHVQQAREINWHAYSAEAGERLEAAWPAKATATLEIGLTEYEVGRWQGSYGTQTNLRTGAERLVRRGRTLVPSASTPADLEDEACALCQESFAATPECGTRWRPAALRCI